VRDLVGLLEHTFSIRNTIEATSAASRRTISTSSFFATASSSRSSRVSLVSGGRQPGCTMQGSFRRWRANTRVVRRVAGGASEAPADPMRPAIPMAGRFSIAIIGGLLRVDLQWSWRGDVSATFVSATDPCEPGSRAYVCTVRLRRLREGMPEGVECSTPCKLCSLVIEVPPQVTDDAVLHHATLPT
jgi:hypothetical protein